MLLILKMKNYIVKFLFIIFVSIFIIACGSEKDNNEDEVLNTTLEENQVSNTNSQVEQGYLQENNSDEFNSSKSLLDIKALVGENSKKLSHLKICTDVKCWTVIENEDISFQSIKNKAIARQVTNISSSSSLVSIGSYDISDINETIDRIKYTYDGTDGELQLQNELYFNILKETNLYLQLDENLNVPFSSLSVEDGKNGLYVPNVDFKKEFINGVILDIPKDSSSEMAHIYIKNIGKTVDEKIEVNSYLVKFYNLDPSVEDLIELKNKFSNQFLNNINVYIPINYYNISTDDIKENYSLTVNDFEVTYEIVLLNNQNYILFATDFTVFKIILDHK